MCKPEVAEQASVFSIIWEIGNVSSSLNMDCELLDKKGMKKGDDRDLWLVDKFFYAKHAQDHARAALENTHLLRLELSRIEHELFRVATELSFKEERERVFAVARKLRDINVRS